MKQKYKDLIRIVLVIILLSTVVYMLGYQVNNPTLTNTQLSLKFWWLFPVNIAIVLGLHELSS
jgi:hypothetical protein